MRRPAAPTDGEGGNLTMPSSARSAECKISAMRNVSDARIVAFSLSLLLLGTAPLLPADEGRAEGASVPAETAGEEPGAPPALSASPGESALSRGIEATRRGAFEEAVAAFDDAAKAFGAAREPRQQVHALLRMGEAQQSLGSYQNAITTLENARSLAAAGGDKAQLAAVLGSLGNARIAVGPQQEARRLLNEAASLARESDAAAVLAAILGNLGNLETFADHHETALGSYREAMTAAKRAGDSLGSARARANAARAALLASRVDEAESLLEASLAEVKGLPDGHDKAYVLIHLARTDQRLGSGLPARRASSFLRAFETLNEAAGVAGRLDDARALSYAWGYLGELYEKEGQTEQGLELTRRALFAAQRVDAPEALYLWHWQSGRLLRAAGRNDEAIESYRQAVKLMQSLRYAMVFGYGSGQVAFRDAVGPVYFQLVDLVLQRAAQTQDPKQAQSLLVEARATVEALKVAELRDYFRDECVDAMQQKVRSLDQVSESAAVVYPVILPDRLEILLTVPGGLRRYTVPVSAEELTAEVRLFRRFLEKRTTREYLAHARTLYGWLVRPYEKDLGPAGIDTLVFVPDGPLRTIPMAALSDGDRFLIQRYAVAITPGLSLTDPKPIDREQLKVLLSGLSKSVQGFPGLPFVPGEIDSVQQIYGGDVLLNENFLLGNLERELAQQPFNVVHIASHGEFKGNVDDTFLLTYDGKLTMDRLGEYVGFARFRDKPIELLTLSACETAEGDDRAALGLAGVAIKAGARSALGTLWRVNDKAASQLVAGFYEELRDVSRSRALALQRAQQSLLENPRYRHPGFWSAFILISSWL